MRIDKIDSFTIGVGRKVTFGAFNGAEARRRFKLTHLAGASAGLGATFWGAASAFKPLRGTFAAATGALAAGLAALYLLPARIYHTQN